MAQHEVLDMNEGMLPEGLAEEYELLFISFGNGLKKERAIESVTLQRCIDSGEFVLFVGYYTLRLTKVKKPFIGGYTISTQRFSYFEFVEKNIDKPRYPLKR